MREYPSEDRMMNKFGIKAFRFQESLVGITATTDVVIEVR